MDPSTPAITLLKFFFIKLLLFFSIRTMIPLVAGEKSLRRPGMSTIQPTIDLHSDAEEGIHYDELLEISKHQ